MYRLSISRVTSLFYLSQGRPYKNHQYVNFNINAHFPADSCLNSILNEYFNFHLKLLKKEKKWLTCKLSISSLVAATSKLSCILSGWRGA